MIYKFSMRITGTTKAEVPLCRKLGEAIREEQEAAGAHNVDKCTKTKMRSESSDAFRSGRMYCQRIQVVSHESILKSVCPGYNDNPQFSSR